MAKTVHTGWRSATPDACSGCGFDDEWECDGRGTVYCSCQCCPTCGEFDGHAAGCAELTDDEPKQSAYINFRRVALAYTVAKVAAEWHSGQNTRGYRLLCRMRSWLRFRGFDPNDDPGPLFNPFLEKKIANRYGWDL